ncbi:MAG: archaemetzincin family Zn-dependent metalloprotease, partial [Elusimicrobiota bacterium]|nr:archaemetzincin family Zn-dependent metalloprotease [Elusimicrobiota bacterium]
FSFVNCKDLDKNVIIAEVEEIYNLKTEEVSTFDNIEFAFNPKRKQYLADKILVAGEKFIRDDALILMLIVDKDLYTEGFNYIFGQSSKRICIVSIYRFKPCTVIDTVIEKKLLHDRTVKTVVHEIGHSLGLLHCSNPKCVMFFSNWVGDTDRKGKNFCQRCRLKLRYGK